MIVIIMMLRHNGTDKKSDKKNRKMWTIRLTLPVFALAYLFVARTFANEEEEIQSLPGVNFELNFKHYSGFLRASETHFLHYWFVESQGNPEKDPLIFWFNGGPGCSSLDGLLNEMGPYVANEDGETLRSNPYAWNKFASVVYIESPAGVGFSYSTDGNTTTDDDQTSQESYNALKEFFGKFPQLRDRPTFITGESYGGVYVPTLTARIIDGQDDFKINLKAIAIGNGYVNADLNIDTSIRFAYGHGIIDEQKWNDLEMRCCRGCIDGCDLTKLHGQCEESVNEIFEFMWHGGLNPYDLYRDCDPSPENNSIKMKALQKGTMPMFLQQRLNSTKWLFKKQKKQRKYSKSTPHNDSVQDTVPCLNDTDVSSYMNNKKVREALHIPDNLPKWAICSDDITMNYKKVYGDMAPFIKKIIQAKVRVLLYYGDTDMACNFLLGQQFSSKLGLKKVLSKQPWKFDRQLAGFKTHYAGGLTYLTIRGAGHMAPQWRAPQMDYVMQQFLFNHPI